MSIGINFSLSHFGNVTFVADAAIEQNLDTGCGTHEKLPLDRLEWLSSNHSHRSLSDNIPLGVKRHTLSHADIKLPSPPLQQLFKFIERLGAVFSTGGAGMAVSMGWGGILFSILMEVYSIGPIAFAAPRGGAIRLALTAIPGMILESTLVAVLMLLNGRYPPGC